MKTKTIRILPARKNRLGMTITFDLSLMDEPCDPFLIQEFLQLLIDIRNETQNIN